MANWEGSRVAVKKVEPGSEVFLKKEASLLQDMKHPSIVRYFGLTLLPTGLYMVMQYYNQGDLAHHVKSGHSYVPTLDQTKTIIGPILQNICAGLKFLVSNPINVVHRDLAMRNILCQDNSGSLSVGITDFGKARKLVNGIYNIVPGSNDDHLDFNIMPPEVRQNVFKRNSDVWSFGILMWCMFSKSEPYPEFGYNGYTAFLEVEKGYVPPQPQNCPTSWYNIMLECWKPHNQRASFKKLAKLIQEQLQ